MIISWSICVVANGISSFLWLNNILCIYINIHTHIFFPQFSVDGHLGCFQVLAVVSSTAVNIGVHVSFRITVFSGYLHSHVIAGSYGSSTFSF